MKEITFFRNDLIGDALMQSPTLRTLKVLNPDMVIKYRCPKGSVSEMIHSRNPFVDEVIPGDVAERADQELDCGTAMHLGNQHHMPMIEGFSMQIGFPLLNRDIVFELKPEDKTAGDKIFWDKIGGPFVLIARHSASCSSHSAAAGFKPNKCFSNVYWLQIGEQLKSMGIEPVAIGGTKDLDEERFQEWPWTKLYGEKLEDVAGLLAHDMCRGSITVDTGIRFIASAVGANFLVISCAVPTWLVSVQPQLPNQFGLELNMPVNNIDMATISHLLEPLFGKETHDKKRGQHHVFTEISGDKD